MFQSPGMLALFVLAVTTVTAIPFSWISVRRLGGLHHLGTLAANSIALCVVSAVFWAWAAYNLLFLHRPDVGVVSFLIAFHAAYRIADYCTVQARQQRAINPLQKHGRFLAACLLVPAFNYGVVLVALTGLPDSFRLYLGVGTLYWLAASFRVRSLVGEALGADVSARYERAQMATFSDTSSADDSCA